MADNTPIAPAETTETKIPEKVYCTPGCFDIYLADDLKLDFTKDKLHLGTYYQLAKMPVIGSRIDEEGLFRLKLHGGEGEPNWPCDMWCVLNEHCWLTAKEATMALLKQRIDEATRTLNSVLELPDVLDKHDGLLDGPLKEDENIGDYSTGDWIMIWTTRIAPILGHFVNDVTKILIQYRRLRKEEQEAANAR